jgi:hypothetical protein
MEARLDAELVERNTRAFCPKDLFLIKWEITLAAGPRERAFCLAVTHINKIL